jgi:hypothetical protein
MRLFLALVLMGCPSKSGKCEDLACLEAQLKPTTCPDGVCLAPICNLQPSTTECPQGGSSWIRDNATGACCKYACSTVFAPTGFTGFATEAQCESRVECNGYAVGAVVPSGDGCNSCTCETGMYAGQWSCTQNSCSDAGVGGACGFTHGSCMTQQYCAFVPSDFCGAGDAVSVCIDKPGSCVDDDAPACGCDTKQYANRCEASRAGTGISDQGACRTNAKCTTSADCASDEYCPPSAGIQVCVKRPLACVNQLSVVCGTDDVQYGNACLAAQGGANVRKAGICVLNCGSDDDCADNEYCTSCTGGTCVPKSATVDFCQVRDPVCGCDGVTYDCTAETKGQVAIRHAGECR